MSAMTPTETQVTPAELSASVRDAADELHVLLLTIRLSDDLQARAQCVLSIAVAELAALADEITEYGPDE